MYSRAIQAVFLAALLLLPGVSLQASDGQPPPAEAATGNVPITAEELELEEMCYQGALDIVGGKSPQDVFDGISKSILSELSAGTKGACTHYLLKGTRCYELVRMDIELRATDNDNLVSEEIIEGDPKFDVGKLHPSFISQPLYATVTITDEGAAYHREVTLEIEVSIAWWKTEADRVWIMAEPQRLYPGRSAAITAKIVCGGDFLQQQQIEFKLKSGPGQISSNTAVTNNEGEASLSFLASRPGTSIVEARYEGLTEEVQIETVEPLWNVLVVADVHGQSLMQKEQWKLEARCRDVELPAFPRKEGWPDGYDAETEITWQSCFFKVWWARKWTSVTITKPPPCSLDIAPAASLRQLLAGDIRDVKGIRLFIHFGCGDTRLPPPVNEGITVWARPLVMELPFERVREYKPMKFHLTSITPNNQTWQLLDDLASGAGQVVARGTATATVTISPQLPE